jgi:hypothetical protein
MCTSSYDKASISFWLLEMMTVLKKKPLKDWIARTQKLEWAYEKLKSVLKRAFADM